MSYFATYQKCPEINRDVRTDQTEGECRSQNGCEQAYCPLVQDFHPDRLNFLTAISGTRFR